MIYLHAHSIPSLNRPPLIDEIHTEEMQYQAPEHEIRKRPRTSSGQGSHDAAKKQSG